MKIILFLILYIMSLISGGPGDKEPGKDMKKYQKGMIVNLNSSKDSNCGWMINIDGKYYKPKNLSKAFHKDSIVVKLDYEKSLSLYKCGNNKGGYPEIYINWMEKSK